MQVFLCMIGVPLLLLAAITTEHRQTEHSLRQTTRKLIDARELERQRIAQELHDNVGQTLTLAEIDLDGMIAHEADPAPGAGLIKLRDQLFAISQGIWEISHGLYPSNLEYLGLVHVLERLCSELREDTGIGLRCKTTEIPHRLPDEVSLCLYRVAQEALQNVVKHSRARSASVRLRGRGSLLVLQVVDDGVGFNQSLAAPGYGLASIRERLKAVNGGVEIDAAPGQGTRLEAWVVLSREASQPEAESVIQ
jgi:signal transduction histidine kinase